MRSGRRAGRLLGVSSPALRPSTDLAVARATVAGFDAVDVAGTRSRAAILDFIDRHADALQRSCLQGHLTGSAWLIDAGAERALLMHHAKLGMWLQPGGHADGDANLAAVALREATEESGIADLAVDPDPVDVDVHLVRPPGEPDHLHLDVRFLVVAPPGAHATGNHESTDLRWVLPAEVASLVSDLSTERLAQAGFRRAAAL
jgi:8-oxo-dGTP pyrophosphatase MutT (NUDIX family)